MSIEDQESLSKFLPLLRGLIPSAAEDIESDISSYIFSQAEYNPLNDYPEEESGDEEEECKTSGSVSDEPNIEAGSEDADDTVGHDMSEDPPYVDEMDNSGYNDDVLVQALSH
ncbi:hypothetical protein Nepgr_016888 [Nepenthes gracilis]|uniref:Uncharacterized protein n=1 Tax=Nepenthes gracilis TaxID=150966 RepID=A0AAD3SRD0_NEPGR|nr:hypothetical protein Nepgr_016888 [Nepenthes gracilis]